MTDKSTKTGFPFLAILCLIFVVAKITGYVTWSWWVVFSPVLLPFAILLAFLIGIALLWLVGVLAVWWSDRKWKNIPKYRK